MAYENGIEMINAKNEVSSVPIKKGKAPYTLLTGSQVLFHKYFIPNDFRDGMDSINKVRNMPNATIIITTAVISNVRLKAVSILTFL